MDIVSDFFIYLCRVPFFRLTLMFTLLTIDPILRYVLEHPIITLVTIIIVVLEMWWWYLVIKGIIKMK